jgi:hypothetical protein
LKKGVLIEFCRSGRDTRDTQRAWHDIRTTRGPPRVLACEDRR